MPLQMSCTENGQNGLPNTGSEHPESYWRIADFRVEHLNDGTINTAMTHVHVDGWHDKDAHDAAKDPFYRKHYELPPGPINFSSTIGDGYAGLYAAAMATPEPDTGVSFFDGAVTV